MGLSKIIVFLVGINQPETQETQTSSSTMSYRRELEKYRDLDEDEILGALTEEELRTLENELDELDPDVSRC